MLLPITLAVLPAIVSSVGVELGASSDAASGATSGMEQRGVRSAAIRRDDTSKVVSLRTRDRIHVAASYYKPRAKGGVRAPGAILVHDAGTERSQLVALAEYLNKKGFGVLTLDVRGHGRSTASMNWDEMDEQARERAWSLASRDMRAGADFLRQLKEIHSANLSVIGVGAGCNLVVRHAIDDANARAVVLIDAPRSALGFDMIHGVSDLEGLPCLIVAPKEGRDWASTLQSTGHEANDGLEYVDVQVMRSNAEDLLEDARLPNSIANWLKSHVVSKGGK